MVHYDDLSGNHGGQLYLFVRCFTYFYDVSFQVNDILADGWGEITPNDCIGTVTDFNLPLLFSNFADDLSASMAVNSTLIRLSPYSMNSIVQKLDGCKLSL